MHNSLEYLLEHSAKQAVDYRRRVDDLSPYTSTTYKELYDGFDVGIPKIGRESVQVIDGLFKAAAPGLLGSTSETFHGWVIGGSHPAGVAADWLTAAWGQNAGIYHTSPAAAVAEEVTGKWLLQLLGLPHESSVGFTTGATMASFISLAAARYHVLKQVDWDVNEEGMFGAPEVHVFISEEAHSSVYASLRYLGFGQKRLHRIPADVDGRISTDALETRLKLISGSVVIIGQAGHINTGAMDNFGVLCELRDKYDAWLHIDGAFGLWAQASSKYRYLCENVAHADSWAVDGHKWLQVPYDSGYAIVRHREAHQAAMAITAGYLNKAEHGGVDPSHFVPELSRRARGFSTWAVIQALGLIGIESLIDNNCRNAVFLAGELSKAPGINLLHEVMLNQVTISFGPANDDGDAQTLKVLEALRTDGRWFVREAVWRGRVVIRFSFSTEPQSLDDVSLLSNVIRVAWNSVQSSA